MHCHRASRTCLFSCSAAACAWPRFSKSSNPLAGTGHNLQQHSRAADDKQPTGQLCLPCCGSQSPSPAIGLRKQLTKPACLQHSARPTDAAAPLHRRKTPNPACCCTPGHQLQLANLLLCAFANQRMSQHWPWPQGCHTCQGCLARPHPSAPASMTAHPPPEAASRAALGCPRHSETSAET